MSVVAKLFFDTNILLNLLSDDVRADRAEEIIGNGGEISTQVLNEFASVASRKLAMSFPEIRDFSRSIRGVCNVSPLTIDTHELGLEIAQRYGFSIYDSLIVAAALLAGCDILYSEDMQDSQSIDGKLTIRNPFLP